MSNLSGSQWDAGLSLFLPAYEVCSLTTPNGLCVEDTYAKGIVVYRHLNSCSVSFINLPGINLLPDWLLATMWALFLVWAFFGVAIISDAFVEGIEVITGQTHLVKRHDKDGNVVWREEPVWNWAVRNIVAKPSQHPLEQPWPTANRWPTSLYLQWARLLLKFYWHWCELLPLSCCFSLLSGPTSYYICQASMQLLTASMQS